MPTLHVELLVSDPDREDVAALRTALQSAGHVVVSHAVATVPTDVGPAPDFVITDAAAQPAPETLAAAEARHVAAVLRYTRGNKLQAAALLGVARSTLLAMIRRHGL